MKVNVEERKKERKTQTNSIGVNMKGNEKKQDDLVTLLHGLFNAKALRVEEQQWYYLTHSLGGIITFPVVLFRKRTL